ncbi:uncharacterized protein LOC135218231 [Macrobrachium nipponense]|uniref:uncharacterized protein LOC135218231 n=1 Tax=Macrobrachium nipponense TaxID=159736 RepID=UPI0030C84C52
MRKLTDNDEGTKLTGNNERTRLTFNNEGTKLTGYIERTRLTDIDAEGTKLTANNERTKLTANDEGTKLTANNERTKSTANDEGKKKTTEKDDSRKITDNEYSIKKFTHNNNESLSKSASDEVTMNSFQPKEETVMTLPPILDDEENKTNEKGRRKLAEAGKPYCQNKQFFSKNITTELLTRSATIVTMLWQILEDKVTGCQFVLVTTNIWQPIISYIISLSFTFFEPLVVMDIGKRGDLNSSNIPKGIWGGPNTVCRVAIIDLMQDDINYVLNFLEASKFYLWPNSLPVIIGEDSKAQQTLNHRLFRNFHHPVYFGLQSSTIKNILYHGRSDVARKEEILVYSRCLYCSDGAPERIFLFLWPIGSKMPRPINTLRDRLLDLEGHKFRVLSMPTFPYCAYRRDSDTPGSTLTLLDSVDKRLLEAVSTHLNFTYDIRVPMDGQWGVSTKTGNWTGMVGELQHEQADFTTTVAPTLGRLDVMDTTKAYTADVLAIVCLKPQLFPQYLVLIKPFTADVWAYIMITIVIWAVSFWAIQRVWSWYNDEKCMSLVESFFFSWAIVLDDVHLNPPSNTPSRRTSQVTLLFWLLGTFVITTGYRSSLVAYLGVQSKEKPIDSFHDLVAQQGFRWGVESRYMSGIALIFFQSSTDPDVQAVYRTMDYIEDVDQTFQKISKGKYAMITYAKLGRTLIDSYYTDKFGNTPFYVGKHGYGLVPYFGWGYSGAFVQN